MNLSDENMPDIGKTIELNVPEDVPYQLIFRMRRVKLFGAAAPQGLEFAFVESVFQFLGFSGAFCRAAGAQELLRAIARMCVGRKFYCVHKGNHILHQGWANVASCKHYPVKPGEVVIGPIWSAPGARGLNLATVATKMAIDELIKRHLTVFFIDTSFDNHACLKVIENCGFGVPVGCVPR